MPIRAVGNKPAMDFPDSVVFEATAAKSSSAKTQTVHLSHALNHNPKPQILNLNCWTLEP